MYRSELTHLFTKGDLFSVLDAQARSVPKMVEDIPRDQFLATSIETLVEHLIGKLFIDPLVLHEDQMSMEQSETKSKRSFDGVLADSART